MEIEINPMRSNKGAHSLAVANKMLQRAKQEKPNDNRYQVDMWLLGYLHDIGYIIDPDNHMKAGAEYLESINFPYAEEVKHHGDPNIPHSFRTHELDLLNEMDLTTSTEGEDVTVLERISDIGVRYGLEHKCYKNALKLADQLGLLI